MKYRIFFVFLLGLILSLTVIQKGYCWSPIVHSPAIKGKVVDMTTKEPIENAVVSVVYYKEVPGLVDRASKSFASYVTVTDKDGKFKIPAKRSFHMPPLLIMGSWFAGRNVSVYHPLYISAGTVHIGGSKIEMAIRRSPDGSLHCDVSLLSLEEKYKIDQKTKRFINEKMKPIDFYAEIESHDTAFYWITLNKYNILYNIEDVFRNWQNIAEKFPSGASYKYLKDLRNKIENNLRSKK